MKNFLLLLLTVSFFRGVLLMGYDPNDTNTFSLTTNFCSVGTDTEGRSYAIACTPVTAQGYCDFLNAVATTSDAHGLYTESMQVNPPLYKKIPIAPIHKNTDWSHFPATSTYSITGTNPALPVVGVTLTRAVRWINWFNNGQRSDPATTESGTYTISENVSNPVPPGGFRSSYPCITLDSSSISRAIVNDHNARLADPTKPPLTMVFLMTEPVLYTFHNDTGCNYVPTTLDATTGAPNFYFWEWTSTMSSSGNRMPSSFYGEYVKVQGVGYQNAFPFGTDKFYYATGFRLMKVTFPTNAYSTDVPAGPPLPLVLTGLAPQ